MALPLPERKVSWKRNGKLVSGVCHIGVIYIYFHANIYYHISMKGESV